METLERLKYIVELARRYPQVPAEAMFDILQATRVEMDKHQARQPRSEGVVCTRHGQEETWYLTRQLVERYGKIKAGCVMALSNYLSRTDAEHSRKSTDKHSLLWLDTPELHEDVARWRFSVEGSKYFF